MAQPGPRALPADVQRTVDAHAFDMLHNAPYPLMCPLSGTVVSRRSDAAVVWEGALRRGTGSAAIQGRWIVVSKQAVRHDAAAPPSAGSVSGTSLTTQDTFPVCRGDGKVKTLYRRPQQSPKFAF